MKVCAVSIVKDESHVILRMLKSVRKYVDEYVIVDTGSSDDTISICKDYFKKEKISGWVFSRPWKNFGHNKGEALAIARKNSSCDYLMMIDADNYIEGTFNIPKSIDKDGYYVKHKYKKTNYFWRKQLFKRTEPWTYKGVLHEHPFLEDEDKDKIGFIYGDYFFTETHEGSRNKDPIKKYERDVKILLKGLKDEPENSRYMFYLGQSYNCLDNFSEAAKWYLKAAKSSDWDEEVYVSYYRAGLCYLKNEEIDNAKKYLYKAFKVRPSRLESIFILIKYYYEQEEFEEGYQTGKLIKSFDVSDDILFAEQDVYDWKIFDMMSVCSYYTNRFEEAKYYFEKMKNVPKEEVERHNKNKEFLYQK